MTDISTILSEISHRPFELPTGQWKYYQEWNNALFLHWEIPFESMRKYVPAHLNIDGFEGKYYISLVAFTMQKIRPKNLPAVKFISDFQEINLRTYIDNGNKKGVYFFNIEAAKLLSAFIARNLSGLPYEKSNIKRKGNTYNSNNPIKGFALNTEFEVKDKILVKSALDKWLTERYCLYLESKSGLFRYYIHHKEWELKNVVLNKINLKYQVGDINLNDKQPDLMHYSDGVKVIAWKKCKL